MDFYRQELAAERRRRVEAVAAQGLAAFSPHWPCGDQGGAGRGRRGRRGRGRPARAARAASAEVVPSSA